MKEGMMILVYLMLCCFKLLYRSLGFIDQMGREMAPPPPVGLSILLLRQLDQRHGNLAMVRCWETTSVLSPPSTPPLLSGARCLGQVLVLGQVELLSETRTR